MYVTMCECMYVHACMNVCMCVHACIYVCKYVGMFAKLHHTFRSSCVGTGTGVWKGHFSTVWLIFCLVNGNNLTEL